MKTKINEILIGLLLGDAHKGRSGDKSFITMEQSIKHKDYIDYLHEAIKSAGLPLYNLKYYSRSDKRYNNVTESVYFKSHNNHGLNFLADMFISGEGHKVIPVNIKD
jgi:hypothetical protein